MSFKDVRSGAPVDWSDPEQASLQARIDVLRELIACNPMSFSEKEGLVRKHLADETRQKERQKVAKQKPGKNWDI